MAIPIYIPTSCVLESPLLQFLGGGDLVAKLCLTLVTPWTVACQAPLSMGFPRQEYWSRLPFPPPADLPDPVIEPASPALAGRFFTSEPLEKPKIYAMTKREKEGIVTDLKKLKRPITTVWITNKLWKILRKMRIPHHLTCLLRNLYAGQEARVRTRHGTMD